MEIEREIRVVDANGDSKTAVVSGYIDWSTHDCYLTLRYEGHELRGIGMDFFEALCRIREQLSQNGVFPVCYEASRNVWPNGLERDSSLGLIASRHGAATGPECAVDIFDDGPDVGLVSVEDQLASLRVFLNRNRQPG